MTTIAFTDVPSASAPALAEELPEDVASVITTSEARQQIQSVEDLSSPAGVLGIIDQSPAPAAPLAVTAQQPAPQPAPRPTGGLLPITGEPLVNMALLTLGFLALTVLGLRFLSAGTRRV